MKFIHKTENDRFRMGKENIPQLTRTKYFLSLNFLHMLMKVESEPMKHHGVFTITEIVDVWLQVNLSNIWHQY